jgi:hypothetical protein
VPCGFSWSPAASHRTRFGNKRRTNLECLSNFTQQHMAQLGCLAGWAGASSTIGIAVITLQFRSWLRLPEKMTKLPYRIPPQRVGQVGTLRLSAYFGQPTIVHHEPQQ